MTPYVLLGLLFVLALLFARRRRRQEEKPSADDAAVEPGEEAGAPDMNDRFLAQAATRRSVPLVRLYEQRDVALLRSLLDASGIPSYMSSQYVNNLLPGVRVKFHTDTVLHVFEEDVPMAAVFVLEYIDSLRGAKAGAKGSAGATAVSAMLAAGFLQAGAGSYEPELLVDVDALAAGSGE